MTGRRVPEPDPVAAAAARQRISEGRWPPGWSDREAALASATLHVLDQMANDLHGSPVLVAVPRLAVVVAQQANRGVSHPMCRRVVDRLTELGVVVVLDKGVGRYGRTCLVVAARAEAAA